MSIIVKNITKLFGQQKALDAVSLETRRGEIVGLLGPNGAGKSTLMKILTCFIPPTSGDATVSGFDIMEQPLEVKKKVGYLPESNPLYPDLYVREFLQIMAGMHSIPHTGDRLSQIISMTGLEPEQHKKIGALSKGYRQRVGLAHAMLHDPEVLILDEPTSGLDPNQIIGIRALIREISREKTILLSTHIMQEVEALCDRAVIIHKGRIIADDSTKNLQQIASGKSVITVEFDRPVDPGLLNTIPGVLEIRFPGARSNKPEAGNQKRESSTLFLVCDPVADIRPEIFRFAVASNLTIISLHREEQKLEEVFQELTRN